jgi:hypothetical protein
MFVIIWLDRIIQGFPCKRESSSLMVPRFRGDKLDCPIKLGNDRTKEILYLDINNILYYFR